MPQKTVFVYGTLRPGQLYWPHIAPFAVAAEPAIAQGLLYDLGPYPAMVCGSGSVVGELIRLDSPQEALAIMDEIEDYYGPNDPRNEYERTLIYATTRASARIECYCYLYAHSHRLGLTATRIVSGDWLQRNHR